MQTASSLLFSTACLLLSTAVTLNSAHAKDVVSAGNAVAAAKFYEETGHKLMADLHHHTDKQNLKSMLHNDAGQLDGRSLRLTRQPAPQHHLQQIKEKLGYWLHQLGSLTTLF